MISLKLVRLQKNHGLLVGEVSGRQRPLNSAFESNLSFRIKFHNHVLIPVLKQRHNRKFNSATNIIEQVDDVKSTDGIKIGTMNMCTQLSDAKAKVGLGEMYAKSYMSQKSNE